MNHVYLAPRLDDALLSCGSAIHRHTTAGEREPVIPIFLGEADTEAQPVGVFSETARPVGNPFPADDMALRQ